MFRLVLFSEDSKLQRFVTSALYPNYAVTAAPDPGSLKHKLKTSDSDLLLLDLTSPALSSEICLSLFEETRSAALTVILLIDEAKRSMAVELVDRGAHSYCLSPPSLPELKAFLRSAHEHAILRRTSNRKAITTLSPTAENSSSPSCDGLIGNSAAMQRVYDLVHRVADLQASVLITGESGTGKELIARAIHNSGGRKNQPFVAVSCGAIPETLIESELFGHDKGAFTGTTGTRIGYFEQAAGGTLFLDEIGELSPQTQVKLLRVLQQREFFRLGNGRPIPLKARVVFATHRNLPQLIEEGKFRLDLYYRLNVMSIHSPSLAERPEDIAPLAQHFLSQYAELYGKYVNSISPAALMALEEYEWPGNVRELENVMQRSIICADSHELQPANLPPQLQAHSCGLALDEEVTSEAGTFERLLRDYKVKLAIKAIEDCHGNKTLAARSLDISRAYLHRLIRQTDGAGTTISAA